MGHWQKGLLFFFVFTAICQRPCFGEKSASDQKWSLTFKNAPVSEILDELTRVTGVDIFANNIPDDKRVTKTYKDQTVDQIVRDLFRGTSFALVWNDGQSGAGSLDIWVFDGGPGSAPRSFTPAGRQFPVTPNPSLRHIPGRPNLEDDSEDSDESEDEPEENEEPNLPTDNDEGSQGESPETIRIPQDPATGIPQNEGADKGEQESE